MNNMSMIEVKFEDIVHLWLPQNDRGFPSVFTRHPS